MATDDEAQTQYLTDLPIDLTNYDRDGEGRGLADDDAALPVVLQMGKVGKDCFNMDYTFPFSMLQAFAVCLARFDTGVPLATTR